VAAAEVAGNDAPDWLVVGWDIPLMMTLDPGENPDVTALYEEGCADLDPGDLVESWARHTLVWINRWTDEGNRPLHAEWLGLVPDVGEEVEVLGRRGTFVGTDERFGLLLREGSKTDVLALRALLGET
jgi:biotin-(acetyl-CoA carboxylase) ligase